MGWMAGDDSFEVLRARKGDQEAYRRLVERHSRAVFRLAWRLTGNEHDAEDVVQETFLKAYRRLGQFQERAAFSSWLHRIAANCAYDLLRRRARRREELVESRGDDPGGEPLDSLASDAPQPDRLAHSGEITRRVQAAMARLSPRERAAFALRHFEERPIREIAELLGIDEGAVKHCIFRAVRKLRPALVAFLPARTEATG